MKVFVLFLLTLLPLAADHYIGGKSYPDQTEIALVAPIDISPAGGFFPVRVELTNDSGFEQTWSLSFTSEVYSQHYMGGRNSEADAIRSEFTVTCPANESRVSELVVPIHQRIEPWSAERRLKIQFSRGDEESSKRESLLSEPQFPEHIAMSGILQARFNQEIAVAWFNLNEGDSSRRRYGLSSDKILGKLDATRLPSDWRAYAGYDALILSREDYLILSPGAKVAMERWISGGGHLVVLQDGVGFPVEGFQEGKFSQGFGYKTLIQCGLNYDQFDAKDLKAFLLKSGESQVARATRNYSNNQWGLGLALGIRSLGTAFMLIALIVFAIVVGPVNLFFWANKNNRQRLLWTTPLISLIASVLLVSFIMLKDGFGGKGERAVAIHTGGPDDKHAAIIQEQFSRTGILLNADFNFENDVVFTAVPAPETDFNRLGSTTSYGVFSASMLARDGRLEVEGDFFQSRAERAQVLRAVRPSREKLELLPRTGRAPQVVSSFSYPLTAIYFHDQDGVVWTAAHLNPGATVTMQQSSQEKQMASLDGALLRFGDSHRKMLKASLTRLGSFSALAEGAPKLESHRAVDWRESPALITGNLIE